MTVEQADRTQHAPTNAGGIGARHFEHHVLDILSRHPMIGAAIGLVGDGELRFFHGHGVADVDSGAPVTEDTLFRIASITKTFTAIAVMQLWEEGLVDLDAAANDYLRSYRLTAAKPHFGPTTIRHLLTHTGGLGELAHPSGALRPDFGESVPAGETLPSLAEFYGGELKVHAEPGTRFVYGNHSPATLGQLVEDVSGMPLDHYFSEYIFEPLGMTESNLLRTQPVKSRLATGYEIGSNGVRQAAERDMVTTGAASVYSSPGDMARYLQALLGGGSNAHGRVLRPETLETMFAPQYQPDPRIPGMGLGFFRRSIGGALAVGHQGTHPGFHSQIFVAPEHGIGAMAFTNGAAQADFWLPSETARLLGLALGVPGSPDRPPIGQKPEIWDDLVGWYRLSAGPTDVRLRGMMGAGVEVFVREGTLQLRFLTPIPALARGFTLRPDDHTDPHVFTVDLDPDMDPMRVVFGQSVNGHTSRLHLDLMPLTLHKQPGVTNPRRWAIGTGAAGAAAMAFGLSRRCQF